MAIINHIFSIVARSLYYIASKTRRTYNEINVLLYYGFIPFSWFALVDLGFGFHYLKCAFIVFAMGFMLGCRNFTQFSDELFNHSVRFLNYFNRFGSNYFASSVWICVALPILIYVGLLYWVL
jgi:hypothetical protein